MRASVEEERKGRDAHLNKHALSLREQALKLLHAHCGGVNQLKQVYSLQVSCLETAKIERARQQRNWRAEREACFCLFFLFNHRVRQTGI